MHTGLQECICQGRAGVSLINAVIDTRDLASTVEQQHGHGLQYSRSISHIQQKLSAVAYETPRENSQFRYPAKPSSTPTVTTYKLGTTDHSPQCQLAPFC